MPPSISWKFPKYFQEWTPNSKTNGPHSLKKKTKQDSTGYQAYPINRIKSSYFEIWNRGLLDVMLDFTTYNKCRLVLHLTIFHSLFSYSQGLLLQFFNSFTEVSLTYNQLNIFKVLSFTNLISFGICICETIATIKIINNPSLPKVSSYADFVPFLGNHWSPCHYRLFWISNNFTKTEWSIMYFFGGGESGSLYST